MFYLPRPKKYQRRLHVAHTTAPDLDKLVRSVLDALTEVVYLDDAQVVEVLAVKRYADVAAAPHVTIRIEETPGTYPIEAPPIPIPLFEASHGVHPRRSCSRRLSMSDRPTTKPTPTPPAKPAPKPQPPERDRPARPTHPIVDPAPANPTTRRTGGADSGDLTMAHFERVCHRRPRAGEVRPASTRPPPPQPTGRKSGSCSRVPPDRSAWRDQLHPHRHATRQTALGRVRVREGGLGSRALRRHARRPMSDLALRAF